MQEFMFFRKHRAYIGTLITALEHYNIDYIYLLIKHTEIYSFLILLMEFSTLHFDVNYNVFRILSIRIQQSSEQRRDVNMKKEKRGVAICLFV